MFVPTLKPSDIARFWSFVTQGGDDDCWLWQGCASDRGYGQFKVGGKMMRAHRVSYLIAHGELPSINICHSCDTPGCMNPAHLFPGTHADNQADKVAKGRQAKGDKHGARLHPETRPRGDAHGFRLHPERVARGERGGHAKLTDAQRDTIRKRYSAGGVRQVDLASEFGVKQPCISCVVGGTKPRTRRSAV